MMNLQQRWKGLVQKARSMWADLTEDEGRKHGTGGDAVHKRFGTDEEHLAQERSSNAERAWRERNENSMDTGPDDALLANPAARAGRQMGGSRATASAQQAQDSQQTRQYTQQGGGGMQKTPGQQMGGQMGGSASEHADETPRSRTPSGREGR
jgi:hypothetical protein